MAALALALSALSLVSASLISARDSATCQSVAATTNVRVTRAVDLAYQVENQKYWSADCVRLAPACIFFPETAEEVAAIVRVLNQNNETFSIKSGGHNPNMYFSSIDGGPLISTRSLNEVIYDADASTVRTGSGNRWEDIQDAIDGTGATVVGGRIGDVGVGGYILGGGLSYLSSQYGWAMNNVVEMEVVLANATIVTASNTTNPDLFKSLKGGGNNFGIVTSFTLEAHPMGQVWGGNLIFDSSKTDAVLAAIYNFTTAYPDPKAAVIPTAEITASSLIETWLLLVFYDGPTPPAGIFDMFLDIGPLLNTAQTQSYAALLSNDYANLKGVVYSIASEMTTLPAPSAPNATLAGPAYLRAQYDHWKSSALSVIGEIPTLIASMALQPLPALVARAAAAQGGDLLALDDGVDRLILEYDYSYVDPAHDDLIDTTNQALYGGTRELVQQGIADGTLPDGYLPVFMNDAYHRQDYWERMKEESVELARKAKAAYDPQNFWGTRLAGGFKL